MHHFPSFPLTTGYTLNALLQTLCFEAMHSWSAHGLTCTRLSVYASAKFLTGTTACQPRHYQLCAQRATTAPAAPKRLQHVQRGTTILVKVKEARVAACCVLLVRDAAHQCSYFQGTHQALLFVAQNNPRQSDLANDRSCRRPQPF